MIANLETVDSARRVSLDIDSRILVFEQQEQCDHKGRLRADLLSPATIVNRTGEFVGAKLRT